jgi:hypothetical protein
LRWSSWHKTPECERLNSWQRVRIIEVEELAKGQDETDGLADTVMKLVPFAGVNIKGFPRDKSPPPLARLLGTARARNEEAGCGRYRAVLLFILLIHLFRSRQVACPMQAILSLSDEKRPGLPPQ